MKKEILAVVLLVVVAGGFVVWEIFQKDTPKNIPIAKVVESQKRFVGDTNTPKVQNTGTWKTYRNEKYGFAFKYPDSLSVSEKYSDGGNGLETGEVQVSLAPDLLIVSACVVPENVPKEQWESDFQKLSGLWVNSPAEQWQGFVKTDTIGGRNLFVFKQGCYECYDGVSGADPNNEDDGYAAYSCGSGINKRGNKAARCLTIYTERHKIGSQALKKEQEFFLNDFIPTLELQRGLVNVEECDGLGESVG